MSNIIKKITKKYKWLRFLNYKTTKLAVLSAALFGLCLSSGASFAKYRDENYGNENAGAAKFGDAIIYSDYSRIQIPSNLSYTADFGFYAFIATFRIEFQASEVQRTYSLNLKMSQRSNNLYDTGKETFPATNLSSFTLTGGTGETSEVNSFRTIISSNGVGTVKKIYNPFTDVEAETIWSDIRNFYSPENKKFSYDKIYCAYAVDSENYIWVNKNIDDASSILNNGVMNQLKLVDNGNIDADLSTKELSLSLSAVTHRFKIVYFSHFDQDKVNNKLIIENFKMLSNLSISQTGGEG